MSSFFNPSFAFSSHLDPGGAPLGELSWSSSLAVVAVSFSGLFAAVALMLACLCCKKGGVGFKELENAEGEEYAAGFCVQDSPAAPAPNGPDVYVLPLTEVSLPMAKQPGRSVQLLKSADLGRHSLLYLEEIGRGWFGKVLLGEVSAGGGGSARVVVKELKASASVQEQTQFLEEAQPYRALQHSNLLRCLARCAEETPYLLVMESCPLGDLKGYLRSCRGAESMAPDPLTLQRMACEVACGVLHLHRNNYVHSDLALRNCLLAADLTVKVGDYGLAHHRYREDYFVTADQLWVPLRWIAPELVDEVHCNLLVVDQTRASNVWSLGVTIWELFELGAQPYPHHSDRQVLAFAVREQQLKLPKPQLQLTLSDRWYEVMQFCWLQPEQRPTAEEVHLLLTYLCARRSSEEEEEEFERRWRALRPSTDRGGAGPAPGGAGELAATSSFPLLEQFAGDGFHGDGDDVLTVTETSRGLNFEYKWEVGRGAEAFPPPGGAPRLQELCALDGAPPGVVPVLSAHSPSVGSEYFIRLEEPAPAAGHDPDCADCMPSPRAPASRLDGPARGDDSDGSATNSLVTEQLLGHPVPTSGSWDHCGDSLCRSQGQGPACPSCSPSPSALILAEPGAEDPDWREAAFCPPFFEDPLGTSPSETSPGGAELGEEQGEAEALRTAQHRHWSSNMSANNNSTSRALQPWGAGCSLGAELGQLLASEDPREPLLGLQVVSPSKELGRCSGFPHLPQHLSAEGVAPAACPLTPLWAEAATAGGGNPQAEPRLAEEAESTPGSQLPLPSIPSPSQEGAPLPAERANAPTTLPASPATGSQTTGPEPAWALDHSGSDPELVALGSEAEDAPVATPGILAGSAGAGPRAKKLDVPAALHLQPQVGAPGCLGSLHLPSSANYGSREVFSPLAASTPGGQPRALDSGYDTENYESPEFVLKEAHEPCEPEAFGETLKVVSPGPETRLSASLGSLGEKSPYRDSAYFSDLDAEPEPPRGPERKLREVPVCGSEPGLEGLQGPGPQPAQESLESGVLRGVPPPPEPSTCHADPGLEPRGPRGPAPLQLLPSPGCSKSLLLTPAPPSSEGPGPEPREAPALPPATARPAGPCAPRAPLRLALPGRPAAPGGGAEEEDEDSEDSDESDEELRCYSVQEPGEDSDEEAPPVPVVVAESQSARGLRGLLKVPGLLSAALRADLARKKKAVSFFDDVTVYLFDQESPTRERGEPFPGAQEPAPGLPAGSPGAPAAPSRPRPAHGSPDGSAAPEGGSFEWDDRFALLRPEEPGPPAAAAAAPKPAAPGPFSRFTVSPAPASRFSITQVSDSDAGSVGGSVAGAGGGYKEA